MRDSKRKSRGESLEQMLRISTRPVTNLQDSRWESQEEEEQAEEEAKEKRPSGNYWASHYKVAPYFAQQIRIWVSGERRTSQRRKGQTEITGRVPRKLLPTMSSRLVTKLWVSGRERRGSALGESLEACSLLCLSYLSFEAEYIPSKAYSQTAIQSEAKVCS
jgi:hypothetical protein